MFAFRSINSFITSASRVNAVVFACAVLFASSAASAGENQTRIRIRGGQMQTRVENGKMVMTGFKGAFAGGQVQLAGRISTEQGQQNNARLSFVDVNLQKALESLGSDTALPVSDLVLSGSLEGTWQGGGIAAVANSANGSVRISAGGGSISNPEVLAKIQQMTGMQDLAQLRFSNVQLKATAKNGAISIENASISGPDFTLSAAGEYHAGNDELDLDVSLAVSPEIAAKSPLLGLKNVASLFQGFGAKKSATISDKFVEIPKLQISGTIASPKIELAGKASRTVAAANEATDRSSEELRGTVQVLADASK